jgi:hypothetical protein
MPNGLNPAAEGEMAARADARDAENTRAPNELIAALLNTVEAAETRDIVYRGKDISAADPELDGKALDEAFIWAINKLKAARAACK